MNFKVFLRRNFDERGQLMDEMVRDVENGESCWGIVTFWYRYGHQQKLPNSEEL